MKLNRIITVLLSLGFAASAMSAQNVMTLKDCMRYAVGNSLKVRLQELEVDDARIARRDAVMQAFTPQISASTYAYSNFGRSVDPETNTYVSTTSFNNGYSVSGGITLFDGFAAVNNMKVAKTALKMGIDQEHLLKDQICLATLEAYCNALYYGQLTDILQGQVSTSEKALALARRQEELGQKGYADVIGMEAELADRQYQLVSARNMHADAMLTLKDIMFWPMDQELLIDDSIASAEVIATLFPADEKEQIIEYAVNNLPSVSIAKAAMDNALVDLRTAKWAFSPSLSLYAGWSTSYYTYPGMKDYVPIPFHTQFRNNGGEYIQLSLSIPIFDRLSTFSTLRRKKNVYSRASIQYQQKVREVEAEVTRAIQDRDGASAEFIQADRRTELQEEVYHLNSRKFEQGLISAIDFQKASDNWLDAKTARLDALLKFYIRKCVVDYYNGIGYMEQ